MDLRERRLTQVRRHPWETIRSAFFNQKIIGLTNGLPVRVLDIGSGDCWFAENLLLKLPKGSQITCSDLNFSDEDLALNHANNLIKTRDIPEQTYDIVIMLDVLEHIEDDSDFLQKKVLPRLKPESRIVISVPAHQSLFTSHDTFLGHYRRYSRRQLLDVSGKFFNTDDHGYLFISLAFVRLIQRLSASKTAKSESGIGNWSGGRFVTGLVNGALLIDSLVSQAFQKLQIQIPGLTVWTICSSKQTFA